MANSALQRVRIPARARPSFFFSYLAFSSLLGAQLWAQNWPQWRGPEGDGVSAEKGLPAEWSANKNVAWTAPLAGLGVSSPIAWGERVFVTSQIGNSPVDGGGTHPVLARDDRTLAVRESAIGGQRGRTSSGIFLVVEAFDRSGGKRLWEYRVEAKGPLPENHEKHNLATPTPVTDGEFVYAWFGNGQVVALDMKGALVWSRHLGLEYGSFLNQWGHGSSPVLHGGSLILLVDHRPAAYLLALDKKTGKERWKADRGSERVSHSTPFVVPGSKGDEMVVNSSVRIDAYDPANGELLWWADSERQTPIPTPVFDNGLIYMSRGYRNSDYLALQPGGRGDVTASHIKWRAPGAASYVPSIIHYDGLLYMTNEVGVLTCADAATGERVWRHRLSGVFFASPVAGDGKIYMVSETGETFVLQAGREPKVLAQNDLGQRLIASPAISNGHLLLRSDRTLFAVGE